MTKSKENPAQFSATRDNPPMPCPPSPAPMPTPPHSDLLYWQDSEVASVSLSPEGLCLRFAAAQVRRRGDDGQWRLGYLAPVRAWLRCEPPPELLQALLQLSGRLDGGRLSHRPPGGPPSEHPALLLPCTVDGPLHLSLQPARAEPIELPLHGLRLEAAAQARFTESLAC